LRLLAASFVMLLLAKPARAQEGTQLGLGSYDLSAQGAVGIMRQGNGLAVLLEPQLSARYSIFVGGVGARLGAYKNAAQSLGGWVRAGFALSMRHARFELTGLAGFNAFGRMYQEPSLFDEGDPGFNVQLPFIGGRLTGGGLINTRKLDVFIGASLAFEQDLRPGHRTYTYTERPFLGEDEEVTVRHAYGWTRVGTFIQAGVIWPGVRRTR
jgi:hypothetical protein